MKILRFVLFFLLFLYWSSLHALTPQTITVVISTPSTLSNDFVDQLRQELKPYLAGGLKFNIVRLEDFPKYRPPDHESQMLIAVGVQALNELSSLETKWPVLGVFVPKISYELIAGKARQPRKISAILLDQPYSRQIALVKAIMPSVQRLSVLYGETSQPFKSALQQASRDHGIKLIEENVLESAELMPKLKYVLENSEALLAIPDANVYSRETAQTILLTSYRYQKPVIGFSQAYVRAGALAAVYSSPAQIARQAAETILQYNDALPAPRSPKYFSIDINRQVARSLNIDLPDENTLFESLIRIERQSQ